MAASASKPAVPIEQECLLVSLPGLGARVSHRFNAEGDKRKRPRLKPVHE